MEAKGWVFVTATSETFVPPAAVINPRSRPTFSDTRAASAAICDLLQERRDVEVVVIVATERVTIGEDVPHGR